MKLFTPCVTKYVVLIAALLVVAPHAAIAEDPICPSMYPCDDQGELLEIYEGSTDPCAVKYADQCERVRAEDRKSCAAVSEQFNELQQAVEEQKAKFNKLQRKFRKLKNSK